MNRTGRRLALPLRYLPGTSQTFGPPRGYYPPTSTIPGEIGEIEEVLAAEGTERPLPQTSSSLVLEKFAPMRPAQRLAASVVYLPSGRFVGHKRRAGYFIGRDDRLLTWLSPALNENNPRFHNALSTLKLPRMEKVSRAIVVSTICADINYSHWVLDHLTRFFALTRSRWLSDWKANPPILYLSTAGQSYQEETINLLRKKVLPVAEVRSIGPQTHVEAEELWTSSIVKRGFNMDHFAHPPETLRFVAGLIESKEAPAVPHATKLYISREKSKRSPPQEKALIKHLEDRGFVSICLEDYSVEGQAALFRQAKFVIATHGAGLANLIFAPPPCAVMEIFGADFIASHYWSLCHDLGHSYSCYCDDRVKKNIAVHSHAQVMPVHFELPELLPAIDAFLADKAGEPVSR